MTTETVVVRVRSHRSADKLRRLLDVDSLEWRWNPWDGNNFAIIPTAKLDEARQLPGVTLARPKRELLRCW
jgi:hypothetical protein